MIRLTSMILLLQDLRPTATAISSAKRMAADVTKCTLLVRHLPAKLNTTEHEQLLTHFGATHVRCMGALGPMRLTAFATFPDRRSTDLALQRLHQLEVLGSTLVVEYSRESLAHHHPPLLSDNSSPPKTGEKVADKPKKKSVLTDSRDVTERVNSLNANLCFTYPMNSSLEYLYPAPSVSILTNITNALASVPRFYVQVLHLMNKMHLPAPFGMVTPTPPLPLGEAPLQPSAPGIAEEEDMDVSSTEESELENSGDEATTGSNVTRPADRKRKVPRRRHRLQKIVSLAADSHLAPEQQRPQDVFEQTESAAPKHIQLKLPSVIAEDVPASSDEEEDDVGEGFGKIEPAAKPQQSDSGESDDEHNWDDGSFVSSRELRHGRLSSSDMQRMSVFRNYSCGEATSRLYIKNLSKQVEEKDLHYVFGRYVDWTDESQKQMFDIRLMKEGRMKGQAFVTLPTARAAEKARRDTNTFLLHDRAMVVQFARSAKPKDITSKTATRGGKM